MTEPVQHAESVASKSRGSVGRIGYSENLRVYSKEADVNADCVRAIEDAFNIMPLALMVADGYSYTKGDMALIAVDALRQAGFAIVRADEVVGRKSAEAAVRIIAEGAHSDGLDGAGTLEP